MSLSVSVLTALPAGACSTGSTNIAATVRSMVEAGLLGLDDPVSDYLGDWHPQYVIDSVVHGNLVTGRQIPGHTDGFRDYAWDIGFYDSTSRRLDQVFDFLHPAGVPEILIVRGYAVGGAPGFRSQVGNLPDSGASMAMLANLIFWEPDLGEPMHEVLSIVESR